MLLADLTTRPESQEVLDKYKDKPKAIFRKTDVSSWKELSGMFEDAVKEFGTVDIVCPGAGVFEPPFSAFWFPPGSAESKDDPFGDRYKTVDINLTHPIRLTQLAISHFMATKPAANSANPKTVVHIVSTACEVAFLGFPLYHATKWGLAGFIHSLADLEKEVGIRVAGVAPGAVKTPLWTDNEEKMKLVTENGKVREDWITPDQVAEVMLKIVTGDEMTEPDGSKITVKGGTLLEIGMEHVRDIPILNNSGPVRSARGAPTVNVMESYNTAIAGLKGYGWGQI